MSLWKNYRQKSLWANDKEEQSLPSLAEVSSSQTARKKQTIKIEPSEEEVLKSIKKYASYKRQVDNAIKEINEKYLANFYKNINSIIKATAQMADTSPEIFKQNIQTMIKQAKKYEKQIEEYIDKLSLPSEIKESIKQQIIPQIKEAIYHVKLVREVDNPEKYAHDPRLQKIGDKYYYVEAVIDLSDPEKATQQLVNYFKEKGIPVIVPGETENSSNITVPPIRTLEEQNIPMYKSPPIRQTDVKTTSEKASAAIALGEYYRTGNINVLPEVIPGVKDPYAVQLYLSGDSDYPVTYFTTLPKQTFDELAEKEQDPTKKVAYRMVGGFLQGVVDLGLLASLAAGGEALAGASASQLLKLAIAGNVAKQLTELGITLSNDEERQKFAEYFAEDWTRIITPVVETATMVSLGLGLGYYAKKQAMKSGYLPNEAEQNIGKFWKTVEGGKPSITDRVRFPFIKFKGKLAIAGSSVAQRIGGYISRISEKVNSIFAKRTALILKRLKSSGNKLSLERIRNIMKSTDKEIGFDEIIDKVNKAKAEINNVINDPTLSNAEKISRIEQIYRRLDNELAQFESKLSSLDDLTKVEMVQNVETGTIVGKATQNLPSIGTTKTPKPSLFGRIGNYIVKSFKKVGKAFLKKILPSKVPENSVDITDVRLLRKYRMGVRRANVYILKNPRTGQYEIYVELRGRLSPYEIKGYEPTSLKISGAEKTLINKVYTEIKGRAGAVGYVRKVSPEVGAKTPRIPHEFKPEYKLKPTRVFAKGEMTKGGVAPLQTTVETDVSQHVIGTEKGGKIVFRTTSNRVIQILGEKYGVNLKEMKGIAQLIENPQFSEKVLKDIVDDYIKNMMKSTTKLENISIDNLVKEMKNTAKTLSNNYVVLEEANQLKFFIPSQNERVIEVSIPKAKVDPQLISQLNYFLDLARKSGDISPIFAFTVSKGGSITIAEGTNYVQKFIEKAIRGEFMPKYLETVDRSAIGGNKLYLVRNYELQVGNTNYRADFIVLGRTNNPSTFEATLRIVLPKNADEKLIKQVIDNIARKYGISPKQVRIMPTMYIGKGSGVPSTTTTTGEIRPTTIVSKGTQTSGSTLSTSTTQSTLGAEMKKFEPAKLMQTTQTSSTTTTSGSTNYLSSSMYGEGGTTTVSSTGYVIQLEEPKKVSNVLNNLVDSLPQELDIVEVKVPVITDVKAFLTIMPVNPASLPSLNVIATRLSDLLKKLDINEPSIRAKFKEIQKSLNKVGLLPEQILVVMPKELAENITTQETIQTLMQKILAKVPDVVAQIGDIGTIVPAPPIGETVPPPNIPLPSLLLSEEASGNDFFNIVAKQFEELEF